MRLRPVGRAACKLVSLRMTPLRDAMRALSAQLSASLERSGIVSHTLTKGEMREEDFREALRPYVPRRFEITSGVVVNARGAQSKQQDVILADSSQVPPLIATGGLTVQPIEAIVATLEVKSAATPASVRDGVAKALSVAELMADGPRGFAQQSGAGIGFGQTTAKPFSGIVALTSNGSRPALIEAFATAHPRNQPSNKCSALVVPEEFCLLWASSDGRLAPLAGADVARLAVIDAGHDSLLLFYVALIEAIRQYHAPSLSLLDYFQAAGVDLSVSFFETA